MAFALCERLSLPPQYYRISDPGAYQKVSSPLTYEHKIPFLSSTPRRTQSGNKLWTHAIYNTDTPSRILNCTALKSTLPRFPYEAMTNEDFEKLLCQCGIQSTCDCSTSEHEGEEETIVCQGKVRRRIFKGPPPRIGIPSELRSIKTKESKVEPPFYDARVIESTSYYKGCKWSQWSSARSNDIVDSGPGPAHYSLERKPSYGALCAEKVRARKRKTSKQLRFIEMVQQRNFREKLPGPGSYDPKEAKGTGLSYLGSKAERFLTSQFEVHPGPSDHWVKRDFEPPDTPDKFCLAKLPAPAPFGSKAMRLRPQREEGPSPASYDSKWSTCKVMRCTKAPFGVSSVRFKEAIDEYSDEEYIIDEENIQSKKHPDVCLLPTWEFKSQTIRMKPLFKKLYEPSPADLPQSNIKISRSNQLQSVAPFFTSNERFRSWYNWIPMHASENTPGPCYYCLEKPKCFPAVRRGPITRSLRFKSVISQTPSPNAYRVRGGIDNVLATYNERLIRNIEKQQKIHWKTTNENKRLSFEEKEELLLKQSIELLNVNVMENTST